MELVSLEQPAVDKSKRCDCQDTLKGYCHNAENSCFTPDGTFFVLSGPSIQASKGLVVCVHGLGGSHLVFEQLCHELNHAGFATLMFDNFGRGRSAIASDGDYSEDGHIKQIENLLSYLGVFSTSKQTDNQTLMDACGTRDQFGCALNEIPIHLIGHSVSEKLYQMGGALASLFADKHRSRIGSLVLVAPAGLMDSGLIRFFRCCCCLHPYLRYSWFNSDDEGRDFYKTDAKHKELEDQMVKRSSEIWNLDPRKQFDAYFETLKSFPMYGLEDCVQRLGTAIDSKAMPIMLMWGLKDQDVPFESNYDRWLNALQSGSGGQCVQSLEVPDCGHNPLMEDAELVLPRVVSFFEQQFAVRQAEDDAMRMEVADAVADAVTIKFGHFIKFIVRSKLGDSVEIEVPDHESILHVKALVQQQRPEFKQTKQKLIFTVDNQTRVLENDKSVASCGITLNSIVDLVLVDHSDILRTIGSFGGDVSQFNFPNGVVATEDCIYIADTANHRIQVLNRSDCTFARTLQSDTVKMPLAVYVAQSEVLVTCKNDRRIHVFDCSGSYLRCIEYTGEPRGLCVHNEQLFVADSGKKCISVLQLNGTVVRTIGTPGTATGKLLSPSSVVILQNELFVCDTNNHRVQVFDLDGSFVRAIGSEGAGSNQFSYPTDIAVSSTHLIVCDTGNKRVQLLDHQGSFLQTLGSDGKCTAPCNVAHFNDQIYVIDRPKNQLCVFEL